MQYTTMGATGLRVSRMALGGGGHSRLGLSQGKDEAHAASVVREAMDLGINYVDTAENYQTEPAIGRAIRDAGRDDVIISSKKSMWADNDRTLVTREEVRAGCEASLRRLGREWIDVYNFHGTRREHYDYVREELLPEMHALRDEGKIRFIGITEFFGEDTAHAMLSRALEDDGWDVVMVGHNFLNPSARRHVLPVTIEKNVGVQLMFAVRQALSKPDVLRERLGELIERGEVNADDMDMGDPLGFLLEGDGASASIPEAAYRFALHEPGVHTVLVGTGSVEHLHANVQAVEKGPLSAEHHRRLTQIFGRVESISGN